MSRKLCCLQSACWTLPFCITPQHFCCFFYQRHLLADSGLVTSSCALVVYLLVFYRLCCAARTMDSASVNCTKCHQVIKAAAFLRCSGFCGGSFHLNCTSSNQHHLRTVQEVPNLFWCCDSCAAIMSTAEFRTAFMTLSDALRTLPPSQSSLMPKCSVTVPVD